MVAPLRQFSCLSLLSLLCLLPACSDSGDSSGSTGGGGETGNSDEGLGSYDAESSLELFSWWTSAGEAEALDALLNVYKTYYPDVNVTNAAATDPTNARERLAQRMELGEPPDSFQAISGVDLLSRVAAGEMTPIDPVAKKGGWASAFPQVVLDTLSYEGELYGVPVNIERDNNLYYNKSLLEAHDVTAPKSLDDFYAACSTFQSADVTPLAVPAAGWVLALVAFETLMPTVLGGEYYKDFFAGKADLGGPEIENFFTELKKVLECSNVATASSSWGVNADLVYGGDAAMYVMGDWAKGYFEGTQDAEMNAREPWVPGVDFDVVPGLGSEGFFTFNSAVFGLPQGALHPKAALAWLEVVASKQGQEAFNPVKGSVPARTDVDLTNFDEMVQGAAQDFIEAGSGEHQLLPGYASLTTFDYQTEMNPSLLVFAVGGERARELDPDNVPQGEKDISPLDVDYIVGKVAATYSLLQK